MARRRPLPLAALGLSSAVLAGGALLAGCGTSRADARQSGIAGAPSYKASGELFYVDANESGSTQKFAIAETFWGRLVDVFAVVDETVPPDERLPEVDPLLQDFTIGPDIQSDGSDYRLETNPVSGVQRLVILRERPDLGTASDEFAQSEFGQLLEEAGESVVTIEPKNDDGTSVGPFTPVGRNAVIGVRFNDVLKDDAGAAANLMELVRVTTGYPPVNPFPARVFFDDNHGATISGVFHTTRVLIDLTLSEAEALELGMPPNGIGLPASQDGATAPNVSVRIPTRVDIALGQFQVLRNLLGYPLDRFSNSPLDESAATMDVVRAMRSGNDEDMQNGLLSKGFLLDEEPPEMLGRWAFTLENDAVGHTTADLRVTMRFPTSCRDTLFAGEVLELGSTFFEVVVLTQGGEVTPVLDPANGTYVATDVLLATVDRDEPIALSQFLAGTSGFFLPTYTLNSTADPACWLEFTPTATLADFDDPRSPSNPTTVKGWSEVSTTSVATVRFSEPVAPSSFSALDSMLLIRGDLTVTPDASNIRVGSLLPSEGFTQFQYQPTLPLAHDPVDPTGDEYHVVFDTIRAPEDLAGNKVQQLPPPIPLRLDALEEEEGNGGLVLRLNSSDEIGLMDDGTTGPISDLRGQIFYDFTRGTVRPRGVLNSSHVADTVHPVPSAMTPVPVGFTGPLHPLGSRLQTLWRYCDLGWKVNDETKMNVDVVGLNWAPFGGIVSREFWEAFEVALAHSSRLYDEGTIMGMAGTVAVGVGTGLRTAPRQFSENVLNDPNSPQTVVHHRSNGYEIAPSDRFTASSGTIMMPFPLNRPGSGPRRFFLWRDTAALSRGDAGEGPAGLPLAIEANVGVTGDSQTGSPIVVPGRYYSGPPIPTLGLPLLMEFKCIPSQTALGVNRFASLLNTFNGSAVIPTVYSQGGTDALGKSVAKHPDQELVPSGAFNPLTGQPTPAALPLMLVGQLDTVTRVSRAHTIWLDTGNTDPAFVPPVIEPDPNDRPTGTFFLLDYRGAIRFTGDIAPPATDPYDAANLDPYGNLFDNGNNEINFGPYRPWRDNIRDLDGAQYLQVRMTWINNVDSELYAEISALGFAWEND